MQTNRKRILSLALTFLLAFSLIPTLAFTGFAAEETLASWTFEGTQGTDTVPVPITATGGVFSNSSFTHSKGTNMSYTASSKTLYTNGWDIPQYWEITTSTKGYKDLGLSFGAYGSNTGPKNFAIQYSIDGGEFAELATYTLTASIATPPFTSAQLTAIEDADSLVLRFSPTDNVSINNGTVASGGTSRMANIVLTGTPIGGGGDPDPEQLDAPTASPEAGEYAALPAVTLSAAAGATIYYTTDGAAPTEASGVYSAPIDLSALTAPVTVKAYAAKEGFIDSDVASFTYTVKATDPDPGEDTDYPGSGETATIAAFNYSAVAGTAVVPATSGDWMGGSTLQTIIKGTAKTHDYTSSGLATSGFDNAVNNAYWIISTSTKDFTNIQFSFRMRSSNTGPKDFTIQYSTDKTNWTDAKAIVIPAALALSDSRSYFSVDLSDVSAKVANRENLYLRVLLTSNIQANSTTAAIASGGTNTANSFAVTGEYIQYDDQVKPVTASRTGTAGLNEIISLSCATEGAKILVSYDGVAFNPANSVQLTEFPTTFYAKAVKDGLKDSRVKTFTYTQGKVGLVTVDPAYGAVKANSKVTLTAEEGAQINYTLTTGFGTDDQATGDLLVYSAPVTLTADMFPVRITTHATKNGYITGDATMHDYTLKSSDGGEKNYFGQLHSHTTNSDGAGSLEEAFEYARDVAHLDFFAVTDHSNSYDTAPSGDKKDTYNLGAYNASNAKWQNGQNAAAAARRDNYISVYGYEMTWSGGPGHMNTFNTEGFVSRLNSELNNKSNDAGLRAYYELLKTAPASISQFNHPGTTFGNFSNFAYYDQLIDNQITLIEVGNGEGTIGSGGYFPSYEQYTMALDKGWHVAPTNNQDNHKKGWGTSNTCRTVIWTNDLSVDGLYAALRERRVYATEVADLDITYFLNGDPLGEIVADVPETAEFTATIKNPSAGNTVKSVSIITNGGVEIGRKTFGTQNAEYTFTLEAPEAGYYYLKVVDVVNGSDRIAVTAPVWLGKAEALGIAEVKKSTELPVTTEELTITTNIFNNEESAATLTGITYMDNHGNVLLSESPNTVIAAKGGSIDHKMAYTPDAAKDETITVTAVLSLDDKVKEVSASISYTVTDIDSVTFIGIDASHYNEYVSGNYKDNMGNFTSLAAKNGVRTVQYNTSAELIAACSNPKVKMMIITPPSRRLNPAGSKFYSNEEIAAITAYAKAGGTVIIAGWSDTYDQYTGGPTGLENHMAGQQNKLLAAIGSSLRLGDDASVDEVLNPSPNQYRLYLPYSTHNMGNALLAGVVDGQTYSVYGGSTVYAVDAGGNPATTLPANVTPLINGLSTTWSEDRDKDGYGLANTAQKLPRYGDSADAGRGAGTVILNASEVVNHGDGASSLVIVSGGAFMSNFEIQIEMDNLGTLPYSNYNLAENLIQLCAPEVDITPIKDAKLLPEGTSVTIEGIATSSVNEGSTDTNKGFFDCIYAEDETAGINLFPISAGVQEGQKIRVTGKLSSYQGEIQLAVSKYEVIDPEINRLEPTVVSTFTAMHPNTTGALIKTEGTVTDVLKEADGTISQFVIDDGTGPALVYINSYITPGTGIPFVEIGAKVSVIGLASVGENFASSDMLPRIRVRDRAEIELVSIPVQPVPVQSVKINSAATTTVRKNKTLQLAPIFTPADANEGTEVTWRSSNEAAVKVNAETGLVTGIKAGGSARVTVTTSNGKSYTITVTVDS